MQYSSRLAAKVDNTAIQDGYNLYHHVFIFSENCKWAVIQQGMNYENNYARRYHWFSEHFENIVCEPHNAIVGDYCQENVLDMTAKQSVSTQKISVDLINDNPQHLKRDWAKLMIQENQQTLDSCINPKSNKIQLSYLNMPRSINWQKMKEIYDIHPKNYEELLAIRGVGPKTVRALALISDLIYGEKPSWEDPVKFSFTVGGKDGVPYPVDRKAMDESIDFIKNSIESAKIGDKDKIHSIRRLRNFISI